MVKRRANFYFEHNFEGQKKAQRAEGGLRRQQKKCRNGVTYEKIAAAGIKRNLGIRL